MDNYIATRMRNVIHRGKSVKSVIPVSDYLQNSSMGTGQVYSGSYTRQFSNSTVQVDISLNLAATVFGNTTMPSSFTGKITVNTMFDLTSSAATSVISALTEERTEILLSGHTVSPKVSGRLTATSTLIDTSSLATVPISIYTDITAAEYAVAGSSTKVPATQFFARYGWGSQIVITETK